MKLITKQSLLGTLTVGSMVFLLSSTLLRANSNNSLEGTAWQLVEWHSSSTAEVALASDAITLYFSAQDQVIHGQASCNQYQGAANFYNTNSEFEIRVFGMSRKLCARPLMEQEQRYIAALKKAHRYQVTSQNQLHIEYQSTQDNELGTLIFQSLDEGA